MFLLHFLSHDIRRACLLLLVALAACLLASLLEHLQTFRSQSADLSVAHMADSNDSMSLVGASPRNRPSIDEFLWGRAALNFAGLTVAQYDRLAQTLGIGAAAELLLIIITIECGTGERKWQEARDLGIPWLEKRWTNLCGFMQDYNAAVARGD